MLCLMGSTSSMRPCRARGFGNGILCKNTLSGKNQTEIIHSHIRGPLMIRQDPCCYIQSTMTAGVEDNLQWTWLKHHPHHASSEGEGKISKGGGAGPGDLQGCFRSLLPKKRRHSVEESLMYSCTHNPHVIIIIIPHVFINQLLPKS